MHRAAASSSLPKVFDGGEPHVRSLFHRVRLFFLFFLAQVGSFGGGGGTPAYSLFTIVIVLFGNYIIMNLFISILLQGFDEVRLVAEEKKERGGGGGGRFVACVWWCACTRIVHACGCMHP